MRIVRGASVVVSVVFIVAIAAGFFLRTDELRRTRDLQLRSRAQQAATELAALVDEITLTARVAADPADAVAALAAVEPGLAVCAVGTGTSTCADPTAESRFRAGRSAIAPRDGVVVDVQDGRLIVEADGPAVTVIAGEAISPDDPVYPTTSVPVAATQGTYFGDDRVRRTAVPVPGVAGLHVVAQVDGKVSLPADELHLYSVVFVLALGLLALAGMTLVVEHRSLVRRATFDELTRLPNRSEFTRRANEVLVPTANGGAPVALLLFDLDDFKAVNDTHGHHAGDEMLRVVGERLRAAVRSGDEVARWGGDEFVVLMRGVGSAEMGSRRARELADQLSGRARLDGVPDPVSVRASVGVALWDRHGDDLGSLVRAADRAMYAAKRNGMVSCVAMPADRVSTTGARPPGHAHVEERRGPSVDPADV
jgi:diguanylate cyclase (GGDEF)-like protein